MEGYSSVFNLFSIGFADATAVTNLYSAPTEHYLFGEEYYPFTHRPEMVDFHNLSNTNLSSRFEQIINTFWLASLAPEASTGNLPQNISVLLPGNTGNQVYGNYFSFAANGTNATVSHLEEVYYCNRGWLGALIISSLLLFVAGVSGTEIKYYTLGVGLC
jgi:hypothetical protein